MSAFGTKRTLACTSFDAGLAVLDTPYQGITGTASHGAGIGG